MYIVHTHTHIHEKVLNVDDLDWSHPNYQVHTAFGFGIHLVQIETSCGCQPDTYLKMEKVLYFKC